MTATTTKSEGWRRGNDRRGQEEAGCVMRGCRPCPARLAVAMGTTTQEDVSVNNGNNNKDKDKDKDGDGNKDEVMTKTMTRQRQGQRQRQLRPRWSAHLQRMTWVDGRILVII